MWCNYLQASNVVSECNDSTVCEVLLGCRQGCTDCKKDEQGENVGTVMSP